MNLLSKEQIKPHSTLVYVLFIIVLFITPNLPMPTGSLGPVGPASYVLLLITFFVFARNYNTAVYRNTYFKIILICTFLILLSDILNLILFSFVTEIKYFSIRLLNFGIFLIYGQFFISKDDSSGLYGLNKNVFRIYIWSIFFISLILFGQSFGLIRIGEISPGRIYFGVRLPFNKPVGLALLSDGKLGIIIAPLLILAAIAGMKKIAFYKIKRGILIAVILAFLILIMQSRSAYLSLFVAGIVFALLYPSRKIRLYLFGLSFAFLIFLYFSGILTLLYIGIVGDGVYAVNVDSRGVVLDHAITQFQSSPFYGVGHKALIFKKSIFSKDGLGSHNLFADQLGSGGFLSFLPFVSIFLLYFYYSFKLYWLAIRKKIYDQVGLSLWLICSMTYIIVELFFYRGIYNEYLYLFFALGTIAFLNFRILKGRNDKLLIK